MFSIELQKDEKMAIVSGPITCPHCGREYNQSFGVQISDIEELDNNQLDQFLRDNFWEDESFCYYCLEDGERLKADMYDRELGIMRGK